MSNIDQLITDNLRLIYAQMHKLNVPYNDDAYDYGLEALFKAAKTFDSSRGYAFSTYASTCIYNGIATYLRQELKPINQCTISYNNEVEAGGETVEYIEFIHDDTICNDTFTDSIAVENIMNRFDAILVEHFSTNPLKHKIIVNWRDSDFQLTQSEIAKRSGCNQVYVSRVQIEFKKLLLADLIKHNLLEE